MTEAAPQDMSLEERLAVAKARRLALAEAAKAEAESTALADAVAAEERAVRDTEARAAARKKHGVGRYAVVDGIGAKDFDIVILTRPHPAAFKAFQDKDGFKVDDLEELVTPCVEYPSKDAFGKLHMFEQPAALTRCAEAVCYLAGARKSTDLGKA